MPTPPHDPILEAVGWTAAAGTALEYAIADLHATLIGGPRAHVVVAGENFETSRRECLRFADHIAAMTPHLTDLMAEVETQVKEAAKAYEARGAIVHSLWFISAHDMLPPGTSVAIRIRRAARDERTWTVEQIHEVVDQLRRTSDALVELDDRILTGHVLPVE